MIMDCIKCGGEMEKGFIIDGNQSMNFQQRWHPGEPEKGMKVFGMDLNKEVISASSFDSTKLLDVNTWVCKECGFMEQFADIKK